jgi:hypothetical protein
MTLVSWPAPPASGVFDVGLDPLDPIDAGEDGDVVLELSRRREPEDPPSSEIRPRISTRPAVSAAALLGAGFAARAVVIHAHDPETATLRVVGVWGANAAELLGEVASSDDDFVASTVFANERSMTIFLAGGIPRVAPQRLTVLRAASSLVAVPITNERGCIGLIEVIDADESSTGALAKACVAVGASLAESL